LADRKVGNVYVNVQVKDFHQPPNEVASSKTMNPSWDFGWAHGLARLGLGINIAVHGYTRLPNLAGFASHLTEQFAQSILPGSLVYASGYVIAVCESADCRVGNVYVGVQIKKRSKAFYAIQRGAVRTLMGMSHVGLRYARFAHVRFP
jgi:hypothetical protein